MKNTFLNKISQSHHQPKALPGVDEIDDFIVDLMQFLFPELNNVRLGSDLEIETTYNTLRLKFEKLLLKTKACNADNVVSTCKLFFQGLEIVYDQALEDAHAILSGDPAAYDQKEVIRTYPGFFAISVYRVAHLMLKLDIPYLPRIFTEYAHAKTGIDIHPGASIGHRFCIDHGTGVVIGETTVIGDDVKVYQGVTLGALSVTKEMAKTKRHPTIEDNVIIYAGATILGGQTVIGENSIVGGNVWITESIPANSRVYYKPNHEQIKKEVSV
jgi:serine O-acetyltransferase